MKRKFLGFALVTLLSSLAATAAQEGLYTYTVTNGNAIITDFDGSYSGPVAIPGTLGGAPVTTIEGGVFNYAGATSVSLPASLTDVGDEPFRGCPTTSFAVDPANPAYSATNGILFNKTKTELVRYPGESTGSYTVPAHVTRIAGGAFGRCTGLSGVTIPAGVTDIGHRAFGFSPDIAAITVNAANPNYSSSVEGVFFDKNKTVLLQYPGGRTGAYAIPNGVTRIQGMAFAEAVRLNDVTIPSSVTDIEWGAFIGCIALTRVTIPASVTVMEGYSFYDCKSLSRAHFLGNAPSTSDNDVFRNSENVTVYRLAAATGFGTVGSLWQLRPTALWDGTPVDPWNYGVSVLGSGYGTDWRWLSWFGSYADVGGNWIWHSEHAYMYMFPSSTTGSIFIFTPDMGWLWTATTTYPYLYRFSDSSWLWYLTGSANPRWFRNLTSGNWESR